MTEQSILELLIRLRDQLSAPLQQLSGNLKKFEVAVKEAEDTSRKFKVLAVSGAVFLGIAYELKEHLEKLTDAALEFATAQNELEIATDASTDQLREFSEQAEEVERTMGLMAESVMEAQGALTKTLGSTHAALQNMQATADFAVATHTDVAEAAKALGSAYELIGDRSKPMQAGFQDVADKLTLLQNHYALSKMGAEEFSRSFAHVAEAAIVARTPLNEVLGALGVLNLSGLGGGRGAGSVMQELLTTMSKLDHYGNSELWTKYGIRYSPDLMKQLQILRSLPADRLSYFTKGIGEQGQAITILLKQYDRLTAAVKEFDNAGGTTKKDAKTAEEDPRYKIQLFWSAVHQLQQSLGDALLPELVKISEALTPIVHWLTAVAKAHPHLVQMVLSVIAATTAVLAIGASALLVGAAFGEFIHVIILTKAATLFLTGAFRGLALAMLANPIGLIILAAVALAAIGYEVYEHWAAVKKFFTEGWGRFTPFGDVLRDVLLLIDILPKIYHWGVHLIDNFVAGIKAGFSKIHEAMHQLGQIIKSYLPFSPAETGPLRDLNRVRIVETIAETMKPMPLLNAMRKVSLAAVSAPLMLAPAFANSPSFAQPLMSRAAGGSGEIHISPVFEITINHQGGQSSDVLEQLEKAVWDSKQRLANIIEQAVDEVQGKWNRTGFRPLP